jgi:hypothetical protein
MLGLLSISFLNRCCFGDNLLAERDRRERKSALRRMMGSLIALCEKKGRG